MVKAQQASWPLRARAHRIRRCRKAAAPAEVNLSAYQHDPVGFAEDVLGDDLTDEIKDVLVSVRDSPITIAQSATDVGKTHGAARAAIWFFMVFPDSQVYTTAAPPIGNLRRLLWGEIGGIVRRKPGLFAKYVLRTMNVSPPSPQGVEPQHFITGVTIPLSGTPEEREAKFSGKHAPYLLFIVDEGDAVQPEIYKGIEGCMSGGHARLLVMLNPRRKAGAVYNMIRDKAASIIRLTAFEHPNVVTGEDVIPGAVSREVTVRRINLWTRPLVGEERPDNECFELPDFLVGAVAEMPDGSTSPPLTAGHRKVTAPAFWYMVLGLYPAQAETQLVSESWVSAARARWDAYVAMFGEFPPKGVRPVNGLDVAEFGRDLNALCHRYGGWVAPLRTWSGIDPDATAIKAAAIHLESGALVTYVDATGVGAGVAPRMERIGGDEITATSVKVGEAATEEAEEDLGQFAQLRDQLLWAMREWLRTDKGSMLPPDERLCESLTKPTYAHDKRGKIKVSTKDNMKEMLGYSPDEMDALALTFAPEKKKWREMEFLKFSDFR
jgi:hypothetical protein